MHIEKITDKEGICLLIMFFIGSSLIIGIGGAAKNDVWIAALIGIAMAIPMLMIYSRLLSLFPGKDLFEILYELLGGILSKVIVVIYIWYAFHLGALVLRNFGEFINTVAMPETPLFVPLISMGVVCIIAVRLGIEVLGRTCTYFFPIIILILVVVQLLVLFDIHFENIKPILGNGIGPVLQGGFASFSFPFAESVLFLAIFSSLKTKKSPLKVYLWGLFISSILIIVTTIRNISVLGSMLGNFYFPSYAAVSRISIGEFIQRIEVTVSFVFVFGVFIKTSICLLVACKGIQKLFKLSDYRSIVIQTGLLMVYFSFFIYDSIMEMVDWAFAVYPYYAFPMQVLLPVILWIVAELKQKKKKLS